MQDIQFQQILSRFDDINKRMDRVEKKQDDQANKLTNVEVILERNTTTVEDHKRRSDNTDKKMEKFEEFMSETILAIQKHADNHKQIYFWAKIIPIVAIGTAAATVVIYSSLRIETQQAIHKEVTTVLKSIF